MKLASILDEKLIFVGVKGTSREEIYADMLERIHEALEIPVDGFAGEIIAREESIGIAYDGVVLPHLRPAGLTDLYIAVGILETPVKFTGRDQSPSSIVILSLISGSTSDLYLKALAAFGRYFRNKDKQKQFAACPDSDAVRALLIADDVTLKKNITAEDLMTPRSTGVHPDDSLSVALDLFNRENTALLPVLDDEGKLIGVLCANTVIRHFVPEYIFMMENLKFLNSFEAFDRIFKEENSEKVRSFMEEPQHLMHSDTPLIQFTVTLLKENAVKMFVVDHHHKLLGELTIKNIIHKVLRG